MQALPPVRQVVLLGAGMDTRPWRMQLPPGPQYSPHEIQARMQIHLPSKGWMPEP